MDEISIGKINRVDNALANSVGYINNFKLTMQIGHQSKLKNSGHFECQVSLSSE